MKSRPSDRRPPAARSLPTLAIVSVVVALAGPAPCRAELIIIAPNVVAAAGGSGSFDILIRDVGGTSYDVAADAVQVSLSGVSGVTFTAATIDTIAAPYLYVLSGTSPQFPLSIDSFPNTSFTAVDTEFGPLGHREIDPGDTFGLVHVSYTVASSAITPQAPGMIAISPYGANSSLSDDSSPPMAIPFTVVNGTFTVLPAVVPEPATLTSTTIGLACLGAYARRRRRLAPVLAGSKSKNKT